jgi:phosphoribosylanthranilate isomerase
MTKIKICGITRKTDALSAAELSVDMMGFVFYAKSKRYVDVPLAADIIGELPSGIEKVGVFVDETRERTLSVAQDVGLTMLQFHGNEDPDFCASFRDRYRVIKAFRIKTGKDLKTINNYEVDFVLLDTYQPDVIGGTGTTFDWAILKDFEILRPVILSGGLNPDNVSRAIQEVVPYGVDVASGVESAPGKKDAKLMKKFVENVRKA